jgi:16S rRNA (guanine527-N7)-methyltransferase
MTQPDIASLLVPYVETNGLGFDLPESLLAQFSIYLDLLLRWNARTNLTAVRAPEEMVTRHFGESLFAARQIFPAGNSSLAPATSLADVGSGAGFPGLPMKLWAPQLQVALIESRQRKATFLREVVRALKLTGVEVRSRRAELVTETFEIVTLRAVESFDEVVVVASRLVRPGGRLGLLIGEDQAAKARKVLPVLQWEKPVPIPNSLRRVVLVGIVPEASSL